MGVEELEITLGKLEERTDLTDKDIYNLSGLLGVMDYSERLADLVDEKRKWKKDDTLVKLEVTHYMIQRISKDRKGRKEGYGLAGLRSIPAGQGQISEGGLFEPIEEKIYGEKESDKKKGFLNRLFRRR